jgi:hypothetical protein
MLNSTSLSCKRLRRLERLENWGNVEGLEYSKKSFDD